MKKASQILLVIIVLVVAVLSCSASGNSPGSVQTNDNILYLGEVDDFYFYEVKLSTEVSCLATIYVKGGASWDDFMTSCPAQVNLP